MIVAPAIVPSRFTCSGAFSGSATFTAYNGLAPKILSKGRLLSSANICPLSNDEAIIFPSKGALNCCSFCFL